MSAKKPWFKARLGWGFETPRDGGFYCTESSDVKKIETRLRVTDARELTAEKAVERVLQEYWNIHQPYIVNGTVNMMAESANMTATVKNGKVTVRRGKR